MFINPENLPCGLGDLGLDYSKPTLIATEERDFNADANDGFFKPCVDGDDTFYVAQLSWNPTDDEKATLHRVVGDKNARFLLSTLDSARSQIGYDDEEDIHDRRPDGTIYGDDEDWSDGDNTIVGPNSSLDDEEMPF